MSSSTEKKESKFLKKDMNFSIYIPDGYENTRLPVLYFFHGRTGNEQILFQLGMDKTADALISEHRIKPFIIVCPNMDNSRGINSSVEYKEVPGKYSTVYKGMYEDYFIRELLPYIDSRYNTLPDKSGRFIGGISAGGYIALHNGLRHPELFSKIGGHMPAVDLAFEDEDECYFSDAEMWKKYDPVTIAKKICRINTMIYLDDGNEDAGRFFVACEKLYETLKDKALSVENHIFDGGHNGQYVISNMEKYFEFYGKCD